MLLIKRITDRQEEMTLWRTDIIDGASFLLAL